MLGIRKAVEGDLDRMVALWLAPMQELPAEENFMREPLERGHRCRPDAAYIAQKRAQWQDMLSAETGGVLVAYEGEDLQGFLQYYYGYGGEDGVSVQIVGQAEKPLLIAAAKQALADGKNKLYISIEHVEHARREMILELGARKDGIQGCMYTYYELFVWDDLEALAANGVKTRRFRRLN